MIGVVHLVTFLDSQVGGMERQALRLAGYIRTRGYIPFFITCIHWKKMREERLGFVDTLNGFRVYRIPFFRGWRVINAFFYCCGSLLLLFILQRRYRIIHAHQLQTSGVIATLARLLLPTKRVIIKNCCGGEFGDVRFLMRLPGHAILLALMRRLVSYFIAVSPETEEEMFSIGLSRVLLLPNGVDTDFFSPVSTEVRDALRRRLLAHSEDKKILLFVGRLTEQKNLFLLFDAVARIASNVLLLLVGDGDLRKPLADYSVEKSLQERVVFYGSVSDARDFYRIADIFVLPSRAEGMSNVLLEAMSSGISCIGSDIPSIRFVLTDTNDGLIFPRSDSDALAQQISFLLTDHNRALSLAHHARETIKQRFSLERVGGRYISLYESLLTQ